jgi:hypothetical protein
VSVGSFPLVLELRATISLYATVLPRFVNDRPSMLICAFRRLAKFAELPAQSQFKARQILPSSTGQSLPQQLSLTMLA